MKKIILTGIGIFLIAVAAGYALVSLSGYLPPFPAKFPLAKNAEQNDQQRIVLILVDDLQAKLPLIESIWMVYTYPNAQPYLVFTPIYSLKDIKDHPELQENFKNNILGKISAGFWQTLGKEYTLKWNASIIVDNESLSLFYKQVAGKNAPKALSIAADQNMPADYDTVLVKTLKAYCKKLKTGTNNAKFSLDWSTLQPNIESGISTHKMIESWNWFLKNQQESPCNIVTKK